MPRKKASRSGIFSSTLNWPRSLMFQRPRPKKISCSLNMVDRGLEDDNISGVPKSVIFNFAKIAANYFEVFYPFYSTVILLTDKNRIRILADTKQ